MGNPAFALFLITLRPPHHSRQGEAGDVDSNVAYAHEHRRMVGHSATEEHLRRGVTKGAAAAQPLPAARRGRAKVDKDAKARRKVQEEKVAERQQEAAALFRREEEAEGRGAAALRALARFHRADAVAFARRFAAAEPAERRRLVDAFVSAGGGK